MKVAQTIVKKNPGSGMEFGEIANISPNLIFVFGSRALFENPVWVPQLKSKFKDALVLGCTTAGEIAKEGVFDESLVMTGIHFDKTKLKATHGRLSSEAGSRAAGQEIGSQLVGPDLKCVFVLGQGVGINGTDLVEGIKEKVGPNVVVTGGLAGDAARFQKTFTLLNGEVYSDRVVAVGMYGEAFSIGFGSEGGWDPFGPVRRVTRSQGNVLFEIDGKRALDIYKEYLGKKAADLPGSGLLYPLALLENDNSSSGIIRTLLSIDEEKGSLVLAGDIPQGSLVRLMHADTKGLVTGAKGAADRARSRSSVQTGDQVGLLVSCVGRKLVMGDDVDEEVEAVSEVLGKQTVLTGFYSYGEICPILGAHDVKLHNQTMTITIMSERK